MDYEEILGKRRSIRKFLNVPVEREKLAKICAAGNEAPCAGNIPNWRFILVEDDEMKKKIASSALDQMWIAKAPAIIVVCSEPYRIQQFYGLRGERLYAVQNCSAAIENMLLQAVNLGLASCWVSAFDENALSHALDCPETARPQAILPIGYASEQVPRPMRYKLDDITFIGKWGNKEEFRDAYLRDYHLAEKVTKGAKKLLGKVDNKINKSAERPDTLLGKIKRKFKR